MTPHPGAFASRTHAVSEDDVRAFVDLVGDANPMHTDDGFAALSRFGRRVAPGMWSASFVSGILGSELPGPGTIYLSQTLRFLQPVFIGDTITGRVEVLRVRPDKPVVTLSTTCRNQRGELVLDGEAVVMIDVRKDVA